MIVAFIGKVLTGKDQRENFDESLAVCQNSSDFSTIKVLRYTVYVTGFAKTRHNPARTEIHFIA